jgi:hypothetical protein
MQEYVLGFMFDVPAEQVLLIKKAKPDWQAGKLNGVNAEYWGEHAVTLGFANVSLGRAILNQPESGKGREFKAFVIPKVCPTMKKVT